MPEDYEERIKFESEPDNLIPWESIMQETYIYTGDKKQRWEKIGKRYSTTATKKISDDIRDWLDERGIVKKK